MRRPALLRGIILLAFCACSKPDDQAIRDQINEMKQEAEAADWPSFQEHISRRYQDDSGNNYFIITQLIRNDVQGVQGLEAEVEIMGISISEDQAQAQLKLIARGKRSGKLYYLVGRDDLPEYPRLWFKKEGRHWRLLKVDGIKGSEESSW